MYPIKLLYLLVKLIWGTIHFKFERSINFWHFKGVTREYVAQINVKSLWYFKFNV